MEGDFCNAFWSVDDSGVDAVLTRLKAGSKALEDLRAFYKDRAAIEEDYAKRLLRLSRQHLGKDETGSMKAALERVRMETANIGDAHEKLAAMMKTSLEGKTKEFDAGRDARKRNPQASIEKLLKSKQQQELLVNKAREKYKADCIAINGYTAQTSLVQGRDLDRVSAKLDKAQATIQINEKEYKAYLSALKETTSTWNLEWKAFCDLVQDLEEERLNYIRISLWEYANGQSFICVTDDEFCENIRKSLETCDAQTDLHDFVKRHATGNKMAEPPGFVDFTRGDGALPKVTFKTANFARSSARQEIIHTGQSLQDLASAIKPSGQPPMSQPPSRDSRATSRNRHDSYQSGSSSRPRSDYSEREREEPPRSTSQQDLTPRKTQEPAALPSSVVEPSPQRYSASQEAIRNYAREHSTPSSPKAEPKVEPKAPTAEKPQLDAVRKDAIPTQPKSPAPTFGRTDNKQDPIALALAALRDPHRSAEAAEKYSPLERQKSKSSLTSRSSYAAPAAAANRLAGPSSDVAPQPHPTVRPVSAAYNSARPSSPYHPPPSPARPTSPYYQAPQYDPAARPRSPYNQQLPSSPAPTAAMMRPPTANQNVAGTQNVVNSYQQSFPGEHQRPRSRANSVASHRSAQPPAQQPASVTAYDRARNASPAPQAYGQAGLQQPFQQSTRPASPRPASAYQPHPPQQQQQQQPRYAQQQAPIMQNRPVSPAYHPQQQFGTPHPGPVMSPTSMMSPGPYPGGPMSPAPSSGPAPLHQQRPLAHQHTPSQSSLSMQSGEPVPYQHPGQSQPQDYQRTVASRQSLDYSRTPSYASSGHQPPPPGPQPAQMTPAQIYAQQAMQGRGPQPQQAYAPQAHAPAPHTMARPMSVANLQQPYQQAPVRSPSPAQMHQMPVSQSMPQVGSTGHGAPVNPAQPHGRPVLFFVRAMYDYQAQIPEEFSFQADDIIAVFSTDPDGWWQGELLDETRKRLGGNTFPSNFCTLLE